MNLTVNAYYIELTFEHERDLCETIATLDLHHIPHIIRRESLDREIINIQWSDVPDKTAMRTLLLMRLYLPALEEDTCK